MVIPIMLIKENNIFLLYLALKSEGTESDWIKVFCITVCISFMSIILK